MDSDILIWPDGTIRFIYDDELAGVFSDEEQQTRRASHVEPHPKGGWLADMRPSDGPVLCANGTARRSGINHVKRLTGFTTRQAALDAERAWLREHWGL